MIRDYVDMAHQVLTATGHAVSEVSAIGVGCGGPLDPDSGVIYSPPNLPGWDELPLASLLWAEFGLPVWIDNDANAAALAERWLGAGRGCDPMIYMTISTGIGGGIVAKGELYRGATGNAGELGHIVVRAGGRPCKCGGRGCLEAYCSGPSIAARAQEALTRVPNSRLAQLGRPPRAEDVVGLARAGDMLATELWRETIELLSAGLVSVVNAFEPQVIVLGGGVTRIGEALFAPLRQTVCANAMRRPGEPARIVPAALGDEVGILGAAAVARSRMQ
jgi:glucokinase